MDTGVKQAQRDYMLAFKLAVVEQVEKGELACRQAQDRYAIQGKSMVLVWLAKARSPELGSDGIIRSHD